MHFESPCQGKLNVSVIQNYLNTTSNNAHISTGVDNNKLQIKTFFYTGTYNKIEHSGFLQ